MAYKLENKNNTSSPNITYPYGDIKDDSGANDGTPVDRVVYGDFHQFFAKLADEAGVELNDSPDNATNGFQYFESLQKLNNERQIANNGVFNYDSDSLDVDPLEVNSVLKRITVSENNIYAQAEDGGDIKIFQISKSTNLEIGSITVGGNPEYNGESKDIFFDDTSGMLYVLFQNGVNPGFLVYDESLVYQPLLSVTNTGSVFTAEAIAVNSNSVLICGDDGANGHYIVYPKSTLIKLVKTSSDTLLYKEIYVNPRGNSVQIIGSNGADLVCAVWLSGEKVSNINISSNNKFSIIYYDLFTNRFYAKGAESSLTQEVMTECMSNYPIGSSDLNVKGVDSFNLVSDTGSAYPLSDLVFYKNEIYSISKLGHTRKYVRTI
jgi:hypothetical protein